MNKSLRDLLQSDHYNSLIGELRCACGSYLKPPILLCKNGHSSCKRCRRRFQQCSTCKEPYTDTRSVTLEALADKMQFPCPNKGCSVKLAISLVDEHKSICMFRPTMCLMHEVYGGCTWEGKASEWLDHCIESHPERITDVPFVSFSDPWSPRTRNPVMRYHLLKCFDRLFNVYQIYDCKSGKMMWTVITTGDNNEDSKTYYFDLEIYNPDNALRYIMIRQPCKTETDSDILEASQNVLIPLEQIMYMLDDNKNIHFKMHIYETKDESPPAPADLIFE